MLENSAGWIGVQVEPHAEQSNNLRSVCGKGFRLMPELWLIGKGRISI